MSVARIGHIAVLLRSGKVLVASWVGHDSTDIAELYILAPQFRPLPKMTARRGRPNATLLATGDVLITGGADHDAPGGVATAEIYRATDCASTARPHAFCPYRPHHHFLPTDVS